MSEAGPAERASTLDPVERAMRLRASIDAIPEKPRDAIFELIRQLSGGSTSCGSQSALLRPWREVLEIASDLHLDGEDMRAIIESRYRRLAKERHPDTQTGSHDAFAELNVAVERARDEFGT